MQCPSCGAQNEYGAKFCESCGRSLTVKPGNPILYTVALWLGAALQTFALILFEEREEEAGVIFLLIGIALGLFSAIYLLILLHRSWAAIQGPWAKTTPGKAVGFLFIPIFNFYWIFQAVRGLAVGSRAYLEASRPGTKSPINEPVSVALGIFFIVTFIPVVGWFTFVVTMILWNILVFQWCRFLNIVTTATV